MAKICFLLLCHKDPARIVERVTMLTDSGDYVSIHFDGRGSSADFTVIEEGMKDNPKVCFATRVKCGWGEWSLVQGTLNALKAGFKDFPEATHFYMLSGDCMPIKPMRHMHAFLDNSGKDFIEHHDFLESDCIKVGFKEERLIYRHWFNERASKPLFYASVAVQKALGMKRVLPEGLQIMIGSQWWVLRRSTIAKLLQFIKKRHDIPQFFKTTWIPDETFFQSLVMHLVAGNEVESRTLTFLRAADSVLRRPPEFSADAKLPVCPQNFSASGRPESGAGERVSLLERNADRIGWAAIGCVPQWTRAFGASVWRAWRPDRATEHIANRGLQKMARG